MSYADQPAMSPRKAVSIGLVILLHALIGYAFITGLAYNVIKKAASELKTVDIKEAPPPPDKPPPPPPPQQKAEPPPVVAPPSIVRTVTTTPVIATVAVPPPVVAPPVVAPPAPAPAPVIHTVSQAAQAKGNPRDWITNDDYPSSAARDGKSGVSGIAWTINEQGKVENCHTVSSSGTPELDDTACKLITRRAKYSPAKDQAGNPVRQSSSINFRWVLPQD